MSIRKMIPKRGSRAFTLLELIVVIVILGILAALAIPTFKRVIATSELEVAEVTAASVVRETLALSAFNQEGLITEDSITTAAADLPGRVAYSSGTYAAETVPYRVVFGKWEFSGNDRTLSAVRSGTPLGSNVGVALYVPEIGCAFAKSEGNNVSAWSVMGLDPTSCNGAGAFLSPEELLELSAPPIPDGLEVTFGCAVPTGGTGWLITFTSGMVNVFINGSYVGQYASGACVPGKATDKVTVVPADGDGPSWEGGIGDVFGDDEIELPTESETSVPVLSDGKAPILVEWAPPASSSGSDGVIVSRQPAGGSGGSGGSGSWSPVYTGGSAGSGSGSGSGSGGSGGGYIYDSAPSGDWVYQVQPTLGGNPVGSTLPVTVGKTTTPAPVASDGGTGSKPAVVLIGDSALIVWGAVADTKNAPLTGYHVYRSVNGGAYLPIGTTAKAETRLTNGPLSPGAYCYKVSAYGLGGESGMSSEACVTVAQPSWSDGSPAENKLTASDAAAGSNFGYSVAIEGDTMVVGASADSGKGAAYVFTRSGSTWTEQAKLTASDGALEDNFGVTLDLDGDTIVVGADRSNIYRTNGANPGAAYVFIRSGSTWTQQQKLVPADARTDDQFATRVAISGDTIAVSSHLTDVSQFNSGSVYIYTRSGTDWTQQDKLRASDPGSGDHFGRALALDGNTIAVGATYDDDKGSNSGSTYVFTRSGTTWTQQDKLVANDGATNDFFGSAMAIEGDTLVISSPADDDRKTDSGSVYVFTRSGTDWTQQDKLVANDAFTSDGFGRALAIEGNTIVVGVLDTDDKGSSSGSAYVFTGSGSSWSQQIELTASDGAALDYLGRSVAISEGTVAVGANGDDDHGAESGAAYTFNP